MSIAQVQEIAKAAPGAFVQLPGAVLKAALEEHGTPPNDDLLIHVNQRVSANPECTMQVHRDVHLGALLRRAAAAVIGGAVNAIVDHQVMPGPAESIKGVKTPTVQT